MTRAITVMVAVCAMWLQAGAAENWPQFRGPGARGVAADNPNLPETWNSETNVAWKTALPGMGWSSPIVWGDKVFVTAVVSEGEVPEPKKGLYFGGEMPKPEDTHRWMVLCLSFETGEILWERTAHEGRPHEPRHLKNTYASETPVTDGERVYAYFGNTGLFAYDMEGEPVWSRKWEPVPIRAGWGTAASPVLHGGRLYIVNDNEEQSWLAALDASTGETVWRVERNEKSNWATPFVWENEIRTEIVTNGTNKAVSYDLDGNMLWSLNVDSAITVPTPFAADGLLYLGSGYVGDRNRPMFAVRPGGSGDISPESGETKNEFVVWSDNQTAPYMPTPVVYGGYLYILLDRGILSCLDAKNGYEIYPKQRIGQFDSFTASPWAYNGKIFCLSEDGDTIVIEAGREFRVIRVNPLDEMCMATPAIADDSLVIRTAGHLYRIAGDGGGGE